MLWLLAGCALFEPIPADPVDGDRDGVGSLLDCDDANGNIGAPRRYWVDRDLDGYGGDQWSDSCAVLEGFVTEGGDCDDDDFAVNPLVFEICNGIDDDCDGMIDGRMAFGARQLFVDADRDGHGDPERPKWACYVADGLSASPYDCDDGDGRVYRGAPETCENGVDEDCDGFDRSCWLGGLVSASRADASFRATQYAWFGSSLAAGDVDGDGWADVIAGAPYLSNGWSSSGGAFVFSSPGRGEWLVTEATQAWIGDTSTQAGRYVAVGPLDDDPADEVVVMGPSASWLADGTAPSGPLQDVATRLSDTALTHPVLVGDGDGDGEPELAVLGWSGVSLWASPFAGEPVQFAAAEGLVRLAAAGDLDGDGVDDLVVTGHRDEARVWILSGPHGSGSAPLDEIGVLAARGLIDEAFGADLAAGDLDGDGHPELVVGVPGAPSSMVQAGAAHVYGGPFTGDGDASPVGRLRGDEPRDNAGWSVAIVGDMDRDGTPELVVGAPGHASSSGAAYVWRGPVVGLHEIRGADLQISGEESGAYLGWALAPAGDVNGDGLADLLVGAPGTRYGSQTSAGAAYLFLGRPAD